VEEVKAWGEPSAQGGWREHTATGGLLLVSDVTLWELKQQQGVQETCPVLNGAGLPNLGFAQP
jgi:hypothetical protein